MQAEPHVCSVIGSLSPAHALTVPTCFQKVGFLPQKPSSRGSSAGTIHSKEELGQRRELGGGKSMSLMLETTRKGIEDFDHARELAV